MKLKVTKDLCEIKENEIWNVGDYNVHTVQVELSPEFNGLVNKVRYFIEDNSYDMLITDNVAQVPYEATLTEGTIKIGVYGYDADTNILVQSTSPVNKYISSGTYTGEADNTQPLTPTDKEQMETAIQKNTNDITDLKANKQDKLISGVNIKTINNESILSSGNLTLVAEETDPIFTNSPAYSITDNDITYWNNKANMSDIPDVSNFITKDVDDLTYYTKSTDMQTAINNAVSTERTARENADNSLQNQIDAITVSSDVVDVVSTYQDLVDYDTQHIKANDIIKVMQDSTHDNAISYYRWVIVNHVGSWIYVGSEGPYYTKSETDTLLNAKQNTITTTNKLQSDLVDDNNQTNLFVTSEEKTAWNNKLDQSDLTDYVKNTDYASSSTGGVIKTGSNVNVDNNGVIYTDNQTYSDYSSSANTTFISKGTLENVITGKNLETANNKVTSISSESTDTQYPSAKCVYDNDVIIKDDVNTKYDYLFSLTNLFVKITGTGTSVTLNDTSNTIMKLNLDTTTSSQATTTGKNKWSLNSSYTTETGNQYVLRDTTIETIPAGTYILSLEKSVNNNVFFTFKGDGGYQKTVNLNNITSNTVEFTSDVNKAAIYIYGSEATTISNIMISTSGGDYEPYTGGQPAPSPSYPQEIHTITGNNVITISNSDNTKSQEYPINLGDIELCKIGDYEDVPFKNTLNSEYYDSSLELNKWYKLNRIGKKVLNGSEYWDTDVAGGYNRFSTGMSGIVNVTGRQADCISNYFRPSVENGYGIIFHVGNSVYLYPESGITTTSQFKTWLSTHNTTVYYPLATPTYTLLNDTLQTQLDSIQYALAYDTQTNISQTNNDLPFIINAETYAKIGGGGTSDYTNLTNKPKINNVELNGNKTSSDLGLQPAGNYAEMINNTATGSIAHIEDGANNYSINSLITDINHIQNLHGYNSPWVGGEGKNLLDPSKVSTITAYGLTITFSNNVFSISGTPTTQSASLSFNIIDYSDYSLSGKNYVIQALEISGTPIKSIYGFRTEQEKRIAIVFDSVANPTINTTFKLSVSSTSQTVWSPYENICPITGLTGTTISQSGEDTSNPTTRNISWQSEAGIIYGGTLDVISGVLTVTDQNIASYNGENLPSTWISDRDVYSVGETPTIGAQVVYKLATPATYQLPPQEIKTVLGINNIWSNTGNTTVNYKADTKLYIDNKFQSLEDRLSLLEG